MPRTPPDRIDAVSLTDTWLRACADRRASDAVFESLADGGLAVILRLDGVLQRVGEVPAAAARACVARLKALAGLPAYVTDEPQDGRIDGAPFGIPGDLRVAVLPTVLGNRVALRLPALGELPEADELGFAPAVRSGLRRALARPDGLVVVTGPTGSGKTTTIHSLLLEQVRTRPDRQIITIEDPVERRLPGITQVEVRHAREWRAQDILRAALRHDPDVLVVGEARDIDTAGTCLRAALTGHLVIVTVHAGRAHEVVPRLLDMGVPASQLLPALRCVLAQRLLRLRHADCAGAGCADCHQGFYGRAVVADLLEVDASARGELATGGCPVLTVDMLESAAALVAAGRTTAAEHERVLPTTVHED